MTLEGVTMECDISLRADDGVLTWREDDGRVIGIEIHEFLHRGDGAIVEAGHKLLET